MYHNRQWHTPSYSNYDYMRYPFIPYSFNHDGYPQPQQQYEPWNQQQIPFVPWMQQQTPINYPYNQENNQLPNGPKQPPFQTIIDSFKDENGMLDFNKMLGTVNQVSSTVKQISPLIQLFKK